MTEQDKRDKEFKEAHMSFPDPRCELWFKNALEPLVTTMMETSALLEATTEKLERTAKTVHGENYDNGMALSVHELVTAVEELKKIPGQLRGEMMRWGFKLLGANGAVSGITIGIILWLVKGGG